MGILSSCTKVAIVLLVGILGLGATPAGAQTQPRLLFLGISSAGRVHQQADYRVQLRLTGLGVSVVRPEEVHIPPCENTDCLTTAITTEHTDLALIGRILKNGHACIATLWLLTEKNKPLIEENLVCHPSGSDSDLAADLAAVAGEMVEDYLGGQRPAPALSVSVTSLPVATKPAGTPEINKRWSWERKVLVAGLSVLLAGGLTATIISHAK